MKPIAITAFLLLTLAVFVTISSAEVASPTVKATALKSTAAEGKHHSGTIAQTTDGCCQGKRGNVNGTGVIDLSDLSALVSYLTGGGYVLPCYDAANVNGVGTVDLSDLSALVSYLTGGGYVPPDCPVLPTLSTTSISSITQTTAHSGGTITSDGGGAIIARGVCWSTNPTPTIADSKTSDGTGTGGFTSLITGLAANTPCYVRAYATNGAGTSYGDTQSFTTIAFGAMTDIDGNTYKTVTIGTQVWMAENLKVTHHRNGDSIPNVTDGTTWDGLSTGAYCEYNNDVNNVATYGRLYNWYAVADSRNIAPTGWHMARAFVHGQFTKTNPPPVR